jgi:hypothetical protein
MNITLLFSLEEFCEKLFNSIDTNKDGLISKEEFFEASNSALLPGLGILSTEKYKKCAIPKDQRTKAGEPVLFGSKSFHKGLNMMLGIRLTSDLLCELKREIRKEDFSVEIKFDLPNSDEILAEEFISRAPHVYFKIKRIFDVTEDEFLVIHKNNK